MSKFLIDKLKSLEAYVPGEQPRDKKYIKLNTNESPYPPSKHTIDSINKAEVENLKLYSDPTCKLLKEKGYEVASYSGFTFEELLAGSDAQKELLASIDILIDGPFLMAERSLEVPFRGSRNQRILDVKKSLAAGKAVPTTSGRWLGEY